MRKISSILSIVLVLFIVFGLIYYILSSRESNGNAVTDMNPLSGTVANTVVKTEEVKPGKDNMTPDGWARYSNASLQFSIEYPKVAYTPKGLCTEITETENKSYRTGMGEVPLKVLEVNDGVYITFDYTYKLTNPTTKNDTTSSAGCEKVSSTAQQVKNDQMTWHIVIKHVQDQVELANFIKEKFGSGCAVDTMTKSSVIDSEYDVKILGDGKDLSETKCPVNYMYVIKYVPKTGTLYTYDLGQAATFYKTPDGSSSYDDAMSKSFKPIY